MALVIVLILSHVLFIGGAYLFASGIHRLVKGRHAGKKSSRVLSFGVYS
jgi:hypothetical protein